MMIGTSDARRMDLQMSSPLIPGSMRSSSTRSAPEVLNRSRPSMPSLRVVHIEPLARQLIDESLGKTLFILDQ